MVRVAVVGLGFMGKMHLGIYDALEGVEIAAVCDKVEENLTISELSGGGNIETSGKRIDLSSAAAFTDYHELLQAGGFDFVDLCLPTHLHRDYTVAALEAGYDVFCEKPMALNGEDADAMAAAAKAHGRLLSVGQCLRYWPFYVEIKRIIESGRYGRVLSAELARYSMTPGWSADNWILKGELSGNAGYDLHIHDVDMVLNLFGRPEAVTSSGVEALSGGFGHIATLYTYPDKTVTSVGNWICTDSFGFNMRSLVVLERAVLELDVSKLDAFVVCPEDGDRYMVELDDHDGYFLELQDFVEHVRTREPVVQVTPESAAESCKLTLLEIESAVQGKTLPVSF